MIAAAQQHFYNFHVHDIMAFSHVVDHEIAIDLQSRYRFSQKQINYENAKSFLRKGMNQNYKCL